MKFPKIDTTTWFYKNCKKQRKLNAKICQVCPFREGIEIQEIQKENLSANERVYKKSNDGCIYPTN